MSPICIPSWPQYLGIVGYQTALIGRMHIIASDHHFGFERICVGEYFSESARQANAYRGAEGQSRHVVENAGAGDSLYHWRDDVITDAACQHLQEMSRADAERPFAAVVGLWSPHCPYRAPPDLYEYYYEKVDIPAVEASLPASIRQFRENRGISDLSVEQIRRARAAYFALVEFTDMQIGRILETLDRTGLSNNTLVIYTSDHGDMAGEHGCWWKSCYYEGSAGIPLIARLPGKISAGCAESAVCNLMDIGPTCVELAGSQPMHDVDGRSLWPILAGQKTADWKNETISEFCDVRGTTKGDVIPSAMIRSGDWKLWAYGAPAEVPSSLFDLKSDPDETNDRAGDPACRGIREELEKKLRAQWNPAWVRREAVTALKDFGVHRNWWRSVKVNNDVSDLEPPPEILKKLAGDGKK